jgi:hypothetical protein
MQPLAKKITIYTGIEEEKAKAALLIIAAHVKENFPMLRGFTDAILDIEGLSLERDGIMINKFAVN